MSLQTQENVVKERSTTANPQKKLLSKSLAPYSNVILRITTAKPSQRFGDGLTLNEMVNRQILGHSQESLIDTLIEKPRSDSSKSATFFSTRFRTSTAGRYSRLSKIDLNKIREEFDYINDYKQEFATNSLSQIQKQKFALTPAGQSQIGT